MNTTEPLSHSDLHQLEAAEGWLMLGNATEAQNELKKISRENLRDPRVLALSVEIYAKAEHWQVAWLSARSLCEVKPESVEAWIAQAALLKRYQGPWEALAVLLGVKDKFPKNPRILYHIAAFMAELYRIDEAMEYLCNALENAGDADLKLHAITNPVFRPIWESIVGKENYAEKIA